MTRELSDEDKLSFRSTPEVFAFINDLAGQFRADKSVRFVFKGKPKAPHRAAIANAILVRVMAMPPAERKRFIAEGMDGLNRLLAGEPEPAPAAEETAVIRTPRRGRGGKQNAG